MDTVVVWVLVLAFNSSNYQATSGHVPIVVDNINSQQNCRALAAAIQREFVNYSAQKALCVAVRKVAR